MHALVLESASTKDRNEELFDSPGAHSDADLVGSDLEFLEVLLEQLFVGFGRDFEHLAPPLLGLGCHVVGDFGGIPDLAVIALPDMCLHLNQIDDAGEIAFTPDRNLENEGVGAEPIDDRLDVGVEVGASAVELVDETDSRHLVPVGLSPHSLGLGLDPGNPIEDGNGPIEDAQAALDFDGEVDMAGRIDDVDVVVVPDAGGGSRGDRDPPLLFLLHPVHRGCAFVDLTDLVVATRVVEDAFSQRRFAGVDMSHDPDVAGARQRHLPQVR